MPPHFPAFKPFPTTHRIGTDICSIPRILSLLRGRHGHAFIRRVLRVEERDQSGVGKVLFEWRKVRERREGVVLGRERMVEAGRKEREEMRGGGRGFWRIKMDGREGRKGVDSGGDGRAVNESGMDIPDRLAGGMKTSHIPSNNTISDEKGGSDHTGNFGRESGAGIGDGAVQSPLMSESEILEEENGNGSENESESVKEEVDINTSLAELDKEMGIADLALQKAAQFLAGRFAAKEATMKAHHSRRLTYHSILILKPEPQPGVEGSVAPVAIVMDESERRTRSRLASGSGSGLGGDGVNGQAGVGEGDEGGEGERGIDGEEVRGKEVRISISHDGDYATAVCLAVDE